MIFNKQTRLNIGVLPEERGNCLPTVISCFLEVDPEEVIQIQEYYDTEEYIDILDEWLRDRGWSYEMAEEFICFHPELHKDRSNADFWEKERQRLKDQYYLVTGVSPRNSSVTHITIYQNGKMVHDPHPDNTGVLNITRLTKLIPDS